MRLFIKKTLYFSLIFLILEFFLLLVFKFIELRYNNCVQINQDIVVLGNSHPQTSVNDKLLSQILSKTVKTYGIGGQSMFWTIVGARKLMLQGVKCFIIELDNYTYTTGWKTTDEIRASIEYNKIYYLKPEELYHLFQEDFIFTSKLLLRLPFPKKGVIGNFFEYHKTFSPEILKENTQDIFKPDFDDSILHEFIKMNDSLSIILFRSPQHPKFYSRIGKENEKYFIEKLNSFKKYSNCQVMDFGHHYMNDSLFADLDHMNYKGAFIFSKFFADTIKATNKKL